MVSKRDMAETLAAKWDIEAASLEREANKPEYNAAEKKLLNMHARVKRGCANEMRIEFRKVNRA